MAMAPPCEKISFPAHHWLSCLSSSTKTTSLNHHYHSHTHMFTIWGKVCLVTAIKILRIGAAPHPCLLLLLHIIIFILSPSSIKSSTIHHYHSHIHMFTIWREKFFFVDAINIKDLKLSLTPIPLTSSSSLLSSPFTLSCLSSSSTTSFSPYSYLQFREKIVYFLGPTPGFLWFLLFIIIIIIIITPSSSKSSPNYHY